MTREQKERARVYLARIYGRFIHRFGSAAVLRRLGKPEEVTWLKRAAREKAKWLAILDDIGGAP